jgi:RNA polymerase sigma factor (sigma-70 family)
LRRGCTAEEAEDVFGRVCLILLEKLHTVREIPNLPAWIITTTTREVWKLKRRESRYVSQDSPDPSPSVDEGPREEPWVVWWRRHLLDQALDEVGEPCKKLLHKLFYENASYEAIHKSLGIPVGSIGPTRQRCLEKLRRILEASGWEVSEEEGESSRG